MNRLGFAGGSAGAALASYWAMKLPNCKLFIGYNGIYNLTQSKPQGSFPGKDDIYLRNFKDDDSKKTISALFIIPEINPPAVLVVHGTGDVTISYDQSIALCNAIEKRGGVCRRLIYPYYQHAFCNINSSDKYEEILIESYKFAKAIFKN